MKYLILIAIFITQNCFATEYQLGVLLGAPTGISGKMGVAKNRAVDMAIAYSLADELGLEFHLD